MTPTRSIGTSLLQTLRPPQQQAPPNMAGQGLRCQLRFLAREDAKAPRHAAQNALLRLLGVTSVAQPFGSTSSSRARPLLVRGTTPLVSILPLVSPGPFSS